MTDIENEDGYILMIKWNSTMIMELSVIKTVENKTNGNARIKAQCINDI